MKKNKITTLHTVENGTFDYDPSVPCIISTTSGFMPSEEFRTYMMIGLELIREKISIHGKLGWIPDLTKADIFDPQDTGWLTEYWNPKAYKAGIRYIAFVMPESVFAKINIADYTEQTDESGSIVVNHFKDIETAKDWLGMVLNSNN